MLNLLGDLWLQNGEPKTPNFEEIEGTRDKHTFIWKKSATQWS